ISSLQYSYAVNAFLVLYALMYLLMGRVVDRLGTRKGLGFAVIWWSLIEMLHVTVTGIQTLCVYRALLAVGEAAIVPGVSKLWRSGSTRSKGALRLGPLKWGLVWDP